LHGPADPAKVGTSRSNGHFPPLEPWRAASGAYSTGKDGATMKVKVLSELAVVETIVATKP
jgi:hypothetical protein